jgi:3-deoxy-D-manno-octulosonic-acid transferase
VTDAQALGAEIAELLAPDAAARMARAAWEVCSAGTETTERLIAIVARILAAAQSDAPDRGAP